MIDLLEWLRCLVTRHDWARVLELSARGRIGRMRDGSNRGRLVVCRRCRTTRRIEGTPE